MFIILELILFLGYHTVSQMLMNVLLTSITAVSMLTVLMVLVTSHVSVELAIVEME